MNSRPMPGNILAPAVFLCPGPPRPRARWDPAAAIRYAGRCCRRRASPSASGAGRARRADVSPPRSSCRYIACFSSGEASSLANRLMAQPKGASVLAMPSQIVRPVKSIATGTMRKVFLWAKNPTHVGTYSWKTPRETRFSSSGRNRSRVMRTDPSATITPTAAGDRPAAVKAIRNRRQKNRVRGERRSERRAPRRAIHTARLAQVTGLSRK